MQTTLKKELNKRYWKNKDLEIFRYKNDSLTNSYLMFKKCLFNQQPKKK